MIKKKRPQALCHPNEPHNAKGLCKKCYARYLYKTLAGQAYAKSPKRVAKGKAFRSAYEKTDRSKQHKHNYRQTEKVKAKERLRKNTPENKAKHKEYMKTYRKQYENNRRRVDINFKLAHTLRKRLLSAIKINQKTGSAVRDLGCTIPEFKSYIESLFQPGMTWENHSMHGWHIDHIIPLAAYDLTDREQFLKACHYTNLQPMWAKDNWSKGGANRVK